MTSLGSRERELVRTTVGVLAAVYAATFLVAVLLHVGVEIPLGFAVLDEPGRPSPGLSSGWQRAALCWARSLSSPERPGRGPL
jgi:hypothetical protein